MKKEFKQEIYIRADYSQPQCKTIDLDSEGVLCASVDDLFEYDDEYEW